MSITENIKKYRMTQKLSQQDVADSLGITRQAYSHYENGIRKINFETALKLGEIFDVSLNALGYSEAESSAQMEYIKPAQSELDIDKKSYSPEPPEENLVDMSCSESIKNMNFNEFINKRRKELNMSIDELALKSGIPKGTLSKITAGINTNPTLSTVETLCRALDCSLNDAVGFVNETDTLTTSERELVKKYRVLDEHGKRIVDFVANEEYNRIFPSEKTTTIYRAAKSSDNHPAEIIETTTDFSKIPPTKRKL